jgi:hypothetical protein
MYRRNPKRIYNQMEFKNKNVFSLTFVGLASWIVPGAGYFLLKEKSRAIIVFTVVVLTFITGLYIGSIGVVDPVGAKMWYVAQIMSSPAVAAIGYISAGGEYPVYGRPSEVGQIYTAVAGLLNLLCIINSVYLAYAGRVESSGD